MGRADPGQRLNRRHLYRQMNFRHTFVTGL